MIKKNQLDNWFFLIISEKYHTKCSAQAAEEAYRFQERVYNRDCVIDQKEQKEQKEQEEVAQRQ